MSDHQEVPIFPNISAKNTGTDAVSRRKRLQRDIEQQRTPPPDSPVSQADRLKSLR